MIDSLIQAIYISTPSIPVSGDVSNQCFEGVSESYLVVLTW